MPLQSLENDADAQDWRSFRAQLVLQNQTTTTFTLHENDGRQQSRRSYMYEAGNMIEKGSILLSRVEASLGCHDLRQPYFHKCAVLILHHEASQSTRGIILNRPSNLTCTDEDLVLLPDDENEEDDMTMTPTVTVPPPNPENAWQMNFGGDIAGLFSEEPKVVVLHSLGSRSKQARECSDQVLPNLWVTSHPHAKALLASGEATSTEDFYTFYGYSLWEKGMLEREIDRGSWYVVSTDSGTIWDTLKSLTRKQPQQQWDPQAAGLSCWETWTKAIGKEKEEQVTSSRNAFSDLMLKEWCREMLCAIADDHDDQDLLPFDLATSGSDIHNTRSNHQGMLLRATENPQEFLLYDHFFHKSTVLVLKEEKDYSLGAVLNLPTTDAFVHTLPSGRRISIPIRYGGPTGYDDEEDDDEDGENAPILWLHCSGNLRDMNIGQPISATSNIWTCSQVQAIRALDTGLAKPQDLIAVQGYVIWEKDMGAGGVTGQVGSGAFLPIAASYTVDIWSILASQKQLVSGADIESVFATSKEAWELGYPQEGSQEECGTQRCVFDTNVTVAKLADDALCKFIDVFLLNDVAYIPF